MMSPLVLHGETQHQIAVLDVYRRRLLNQAMVSVYLNNGDEVLALWPFHYGTAHESLYTTIVITPEYCCRTITLYPGDMLTVVR